MPTPATPHSHSGDGADGHQPKETQKFPIAAQRGSPRLYHMSRMDAPIMALMSPYLPGQRSVSIVLQLRVQHSPAGSSQNP